MTPRALVLFSGGLDSQLAVCVLREQGVAVEGLHFQTIFTCCQSQAARAAARLDLRLTVLPAEDDYLDLVKYPRFGYGKGANPCVDCRIYMFARARRYLEQTGGDFLASGEVLGQRPKSQKRRDLRVIAYHAGVESRLLRPLSAKLLPPTEPEQRGWVDRERLFGIQGRSRQPLLQLARHFGLSEIPPPSNGCALTEVKFAHKVHDLLHAASDAERWEFELLRLGRHFRYSPHVKVIVGRNQADNDALQLAFQQHPQPTLALLTPDNFMGPRVLVIGQHSADVRSFALGLLMRFTRQPHPDPAWVRWETVAGSERVPGVVDPLAAAAANLAGG